MCLLFRLVDLKESFACQSPSRRYPRRPPRRPPGCLQVLIPASTGTFLMPNYKEKTKHPVHEHPVIFGTKFGHEKSSQGSNRDAALCAESHTPDAPFGLLPEPGEARAGPKNWKIEWAGDALFASYNGTAVRAEMLACGSGQVDATFQHWGMLRSRHVRPSLLWGRSFLLGSLSKWSGN